MLIFNLIRQARDLSRPEGNIHNGTLQVFMTAYHPTKLVDYPQLRLLFSPNLALIISSFNADYSDNILPQYPQIYSVFTLKMQSILSKVLDDKWSSWVMVDRAEEVKISNCDDYKYRRDNSSQSNTEHVINNPVQPSQSHH